MKPIQRGMTEAVTRDGRKVSQLHWLDVKEGECLVGVLNGELEEWFEDGSYYDNEPDAKDIFAPAEYEWQWVYKRDGDYALSGGFYKTEKDAYNSIDEEVIERYEPSKRECK